MPDYSLGEVASKLSVDVKLVKDWIKKGWLLASKIKKDWYVTETDLNDFLTKHPELLPPKAEPKFVIPKAEELYCLYLDERNNPCGLMDRYDVISRVAEKASLEDVLQILEDGQQLGQMISCLTVIARMVLRNTTFLERAEKVLLGLMPDTRNYHAKMEQYDNYSIAMVGAMANTAYYQLVREKKNVNEQIKNIIAGIHSTIKSQHKENMTHYALYSFYPIRQQLNAKEQEEKTKQIANTFCEIITDKTRPTDERIKAYESIELEIKANRETKEVFQETKSKAGEILLEIFLDEKEDRKIRDYVKNDLNKIAPQAIEKLQMKGLIPIKPVPNVEDLFSYSSVDSSKVNETASVVSGQEVLEILQNHRTTAVEELLSSIYLAPIVARRYNWKAFAYALINLLSVYKEHSFKIGYSDIKIEISKNSSESLAKILNERPISDKEIVLEYFWKALNAIFDRGFTYSSYTDALSWELKNLAQNLKIQEEYEEFLLRILLSPWRSSEARFLAYSEANSYRARTQEVAWEILFDPNEDRNLRALIGSRWNNILQEKIKALVDTSQKSWLLLPKSPKNLPISYPGNEVPESWLMATLSMTKNFELLRQTLDAFVKRTGLGNWDKKEDLKKAKEKLISYVEQHPEFLKILERMCKKSSRENNSHIAASLLILLGDTTKEELVTDLISKGIGGWSILKPFWAEEEKEMPSIESFIALSKTTDESYSALEPYLIVGYGDEKASFIMSKVFVMFAQDQEKKGEPEKAIKNYRFAIKRDNYNLTAKEALKRLGQE